MNNNLLQTKENILLESLKMRVENNGKPMMVIPMIIMIQSFGNNFQNFS